MTEWSFDSNNILQTRDGFVADKIREFIRQGYFEPGKKLDQSEIAELLNVSRSPVREALRTLAAEGLVKVYPHRGAMVARLTLEELEEVFLMRGALEGLAARLGVAEITTEVVANIETIWNKLDKATDFDEWLTLNSTFHHTIYQVVDQPRLFAQIMQLRNIATPYIRQYIISPKHLKEASIGHEQILEACQKRDPLLAQTATQQHIEAVCESALSYVEAGMLAASKED